MGKKLVVAMNAPGPMITSTWDDCVAALVVSWLPGQQNGKGIAMALYNEGYEASGRLPFTFPKCSNNPCSRAYELASVALGHLVGSKALRVFSEKALIGYRWYHAKGRAVSYPFGFGLFAYGSTKVRYSAASAAASRVGVIVSCTLSHGGPRLGHDVPQLYLSFPSSVPGDAESKPEWVLKGFTKVLVTPNSPVITHFALSHRELSYWDDSKGRSLWVCAAGKFRACVGANSRDAVLPGEGSCASFIINSACGFEHEVQDEATSTANAGATVTQTGANEGYGGSPESGMTDAAQAVPPNACYNGWALAPECTITFTYSGQTYNGCTKKDSVKPWCSHSPVYNGEWSECTPCQDSAGPSSSLWLLVLAALFALSFIGLGILVICCQQRSHSHLALHPTHPTYPNYPTSPFVSQQVPGQMYRMGTFDTLGHPVRPPNNWNAWVSVK